MRSKLSIIKIKIKSHNLYGNTRVENREKARGRKRSVLFCTVLKRTSSLFNAFLC